MEDIESVCLSLYVWKKHLWLVCMNFIYLFFSCFCYRGSSLSSLVFICLTSLPFCVPGTWCWSMCPAESYLTTWWRRAGWPPKRPGSSSDKSSPPLTSATVTPYGLWEAIYFLFCSISSFVSSFLIAIAAVVLKSVSPSICVHSHFYLFAAMLNLFSNLSLNSTCRERQCRDRTFKGRDPLFEGATDFDTRWAIVVRSTPVYCICQIPATSLVWFRLWTFVAFFLPLFPVCLFTVSCPINAKKIISVSKKIWTIVNTSQHDNYKVKSTRPLSWSGHVTWHHRIHCRYQIKKIIFVAKLPTC